MSLPLVRKRGGDGGRLPSAATLTECMRLSTTSEAATYLAVQAKARLANLLDDGPVKKVISILEAHAKNVELATGKGSENLWSGKPLPTDFEELQSKSAAEADAAIKKLMGDKPIDKLVFDFAVGNNAELLRGYTANGQPLGEDLVKAMDKLFNAWLAENKLISKGGVIYEGTEDGQLKIDKQGNPVRANAEALREKIASQTDGFEQYVQKHNKSVQIEIQPQPYPQQQAEVEEAGPSGGSSGGGL